MKRKDFVCTLSLGVLGLILGCLPINSKAHSRLEMERELLQLNNELRQTQSDEAFRKKALELLKLKERILFNK